MEYRPNQDIFATGADVIINTVNTRGVMGAGLAKAFATRYPEILGPYKRVCGDGTLKPGGVQLIRLDRETGKRDPKGNLVVANVATKDDWRDPSKIEWVDGALGKLARVLEERKVKSIAIPKLGAGLGGLDWKDVRPLVEKHFAGPAARGMKVVVLGEGPEIDRDRASVGTKAAEHPVGEAPVAAAPARQGRVLNISEVRHVPEGAVYIGRNQRIWRESGGKGEPKWGNPYVMGVDGDRDTVVAKYTAWLDAKLRDPQYRDDFVAELSGRDVVCHCAPQGCHGHVIVNRLAELSRHREEQGKGEKSTSGRSRAARKSALASHVPARTATRTPNAPQATHAGEKEIGREGGPARRAYAGIGSRETPPSVLARMEEIGQLMAEKGFVLRSGAAGGADSAFEKGCDGAGGAKEIYLPWAGFSRRVPDGKGVFCEVTADHASIAAKYHPVWDRLSRSARDLMSRNASQLLGRDLASPSAVVICWTEGGATKGGTGQSLRMASDRNIPVVNLGDARWCDLSAPAVVAGVEVLVRGGKLVEATTAARSVEKAAEPKPRHPSPRNEAR